jgi:uncharacterized oxidoreductase
MNLDGNTVLVTGGASGIGFGLAERFVQAGSTVIICGRREGKLAEAQAACPGLHTRICDVADASEREALFTWATNNFPDVNVLINNAGIQQRINLQDPTVWDDIQREIAINLTAPIHMASLFIPHLRARPHAAILNVTSGLAFSPMAMMPVYGATKAAMHSFTLSLRRQLSDAGVTVVEVIPPAVDTDLGGPGGHTYGVPLPEYVDSVVDQLLAGNAETSYQYSAAVSRASREELDDIFDRMNP